MIFVPLHQQQALKGIRFIDLFGGIGGFRLALDSYGAQCVFSSEIKKTARQTYQANHGDLPRGDITKISVEEIQDHDILCAGFPCKAFSINGKRSGFNHPNGCLFRHVCRIVQARKPKVLLLENVEYLERHDDGRTLAVIRKCVHDLGYEMHHAVLNASEFGIPQARKRMFMVCTRMDLGVKTFRFPCPTFERVRLRDVLEPANQVTKYRVDIPKSELKLRADLKETFRDGFPLDLVLFATKSTSRSQGERVYHCDGHSATITSFAGGGAQSMGLYLVDDVIRTLAPREAARLMGLPDSFTLHPKPSTAFHQIGNSVVVNVVQHIVGSMIEQGIL